MRESGRKVVFAMPKKKQSGLYRSKVKVGTKPDGSPLTKWVSGRTKAEFEDEKRTVKEYYIAGTGLRPDRMFGEYTIEWYRVHKEPRLSSSSKNGYRSMLNKYVLPAFGDRNLRAITATELQECINGFAGMSDSSITLVMTILSGVFSAAKSDRIIDQSPAAYLTKPEAGKKAARRALTGEETGALLDLPSPFPRENLMVLRYALPLRYREREGSMDALCRALGAFISAKRGSFLVCFPSYAFMRQVAGRMAGIARLLVQSPGMD